MDRIVLKIGIIFLASSFLTSCATTTKPDIRLSTTSIMMELKESAYRVTTVAVSHDGKFLASGDVKGDVTVWDMQNVRMHWRAKSGGITLGAVITDVVLSSAFTPDGKNLLTGGMDGIISVWDVQTGKIKKNLKVKEKNNPIITSIDVSSDSKKAVSAAVDGMVRLWDIETGALTRTFKAVTGIGFTAGKQRTTLSVDLSPDDRYTLSSGKDGALILWDNNTGVELLKIKAHYSVASAVFTRDGTRAFSTGSRSYLVHINDLKFWDMKTGRIIREIKKPHGLCPSISYLSVSEDGKYLLSGGCGSLQLRDVETGKLIRTYKGHFSIFPVLGQPVSDTAVFHPNGKWIVAKGVDGSVRIKDIETDEEVALLVGFHNGEWLAITSEGYYNASENGAKYLSVKVGNKKYDVDKFYDVFYRPDIIMTKLRGEDIKDLITITMEDAIKAPPPSVEFVAVPKNTDQSKVKICYQAKSTGGGIGEVRLFHNGKLIHSDGFYRDIAKTPVGKTRLSALNSRAIYKDMRGIMIKGKEEGIPVFSKSKGESFEDCEEIETVPGENEISIAAFNSNNTVQSNVKTVKFNSGLKQKEPHLYILSIGIDQYRDEKVNLKYAVKDAKDMTQKIVQQSSTIFKPQDIHYEMLMDSDAAKTNIINKINAIANKIKPNDSFILFVAGHGVLMQNQYYMLTHNYDGMLSKNSLISSNEIVEMSKKIKSLSQLFIFDTCHAGGVDYIVSGLYDARMSVLAKKMGLHIYASASSLQGALDGYRGNGLFTYSILDGLHNNRSADKNNDSKVSLVELGEYSKAKTIETSKTIGHTQTPLIINFGKDNSVYGLR